jgi:hypothetical protein
MVKEKWHITAAVFRMAERTATSATLRIDVLTRHKRKPTSGHIDKGSNRDSEYIKIINRIYKLRSALRHCLPQSHDSRSKPTAERSTSIALTDEAIGEVIHLKDCFFLPTI